MPAITSNDAGVSVRPIRTVSCIRPTNTAPLATSSASRSLSRPPSPSPPNLPPPISLRSPLPFTPELSTRNSTPSFVPLSPLAFRPAAARLGAPHATPRIAAARVAELAENTDAASVVLAFPNQTPPYSPSLTAAPPTPRAGGADVSGAVKELVESSLALLTTQPSPPSPLPPPSSLPCNPSPTQVVLDVAGAVKELVENSSPSAYPLTPLPLLSPPPSPPQVVLDVAAAVKELVENSLDAGSRMSAPCIPKPPPPPLSPPPGGVGRGGCGEGAAGEQPGRGQWDTYFFTPAKPSSQPPSPVPPIPAQVVLDVAGAVKERVVLDVAGAVKELVENSLDAGATSVEVRLKDFGAELIEALTLKYHTSKITHFADLQSLSSFGFRGEALSSLCALADVTITTRTANEPIATRLVFDHAGKLLDAPREQVARAVGTTVSVAKIFSPLPVRRREFERNVRREFAKLVSVLQAYCVVSTHARILCTNQSGRSSARTTVVLTAGTGSMRENIIAVFGAKAAAGLDPVDITFPLSPAAAAAAPPAPAAPAPPAAATGAAATASAPLPASCCRVTGFLSRPGAGSGRSSGDRQFFFLNGRPVDLPRLSKLLNELYRSFNSLQFPAAFLNVSLSADAYDVNVTPDKRKVFLHSEAALLSGLRAALSEFYSPDRYVYRAALAGSVAKEIEERARREVGEKGNGRRGVGGGVGGGENEGEGGEDGEEEGEGRRKRVRVSSDSGGGAAAGAQGGGEMRGGDELNGDEDADGQMEEAVEGGEEEEGERDRRKPLHQFERGEGGGKAALGAAAQGVGRQRVGRGRVGGESSGGVERARGGADGRQAGLDAWLGKRGGGGRRGRGSGGGKMGGVDGGRRVRGRGGDGWAEEGGKELEGKAVEIEEDEREENAKENGREDEREEDEVSDEVREVEQEDGEAGEMQVQRSATEWKGAEKNDEERSGAALCAVDSGLQEATRDEWAGKNVLDLPLMTQEMTQADLPELVGSQLLPGTQLAGQQESCAVAVAEGAGKGRCCGGHTGELEGDEGHEGIEGRARVEEMETKVGAASGMNGVARSGEGWQRSFAAASVADGTSNNGTHSSGGRTVQHGEGEGKEAALEAAARELERRFDKRDFASMTVIGQFNLGFIIGRLGSDLFIVDQVQHACWPQRLDLSPAEEVIVSAHMPTFRSNGFHFSVDESAPSGRRFRLSAVPFSKNIVFGASDVCELISMLADAPLPEPETAAGSASVPDTVPFHAMGDASGAGNHQEASLRASSTSSPQPRRSEANSESGTAGGASPREGRSGAAAAPAPSPSASASTVVAVRPSRVRAMLASRACRSSVMIGTALSPAQMSKILCQLSTLQSPWNCPHGRPTMRHLFDLRLLDKNMQDMDTY
ncbi:unnamed protein product [Closterium sp. Yama58-4]|nr:unnamed protein product [Closterium sp. Yama58-4]